MATHAIVTAEERLIIKDDSDNTKFRIKDAGAMTIDGSDARNAFAFKLLGLSGGTPHTQILTGQASCRLKTFCALKSTLELDGIVSSINMANLIKFKFN